jgi:hypothetical protein
MSIVGAAAKAAAVSRRETAIAPLRISRVIVISPQIAVSELRALSFSRMRLFRDGEVKFAGEVRATL